jgi:GT2 family glycosyltransferase
MAALPPTLSLSVVIPTYRRPRGLDRLLESLVPSAASEAFLEAIVVNDGGHDEAYATIVARHAWVTYLVAERNAGPGAARNLGAARAYGDFLVFIDDDCVAPPGWLDRLRAELEAHPDLDAVGGATHPLPSPRPGWFERLMVDAALHPNPIYYNGDLIVMVSACLAVRRSMFAAVGGFDERLRLAAEDRNLTTRLRLAGAQCAIAPSWFVAHDMTSTPSRHFRRYFNYGRGVRQAVALEAEPLDRLYWPPERRPIGYWLRRARGRWAETSSLAPNATPRHRGAVRLLATATNLVMDIGFCRPAANRLEA